MDMPILLELCDVASDDGPRAWRHRIDRHPQSQTCLTPNLGEIEWVRSILGCSFLARCILVQKIILVLRTVPVFSPQKADVLLKVLSSSNTMAPGGGGGGGNAKKLPFGGGGERQAGFSDLLPDMLKLIKRSGAGLRGRRHVHTLGARLSRRLVHGQRLQEDHPVCVVERKMSHATRRTKLTLNSNIRAGGGRTIYTRPKSRSARENEGVSWSRKNDTRRDDTIMIQSGRTVCFEWSQPKRQNAKTHTSQAHPKRQNAQNAVK